jgi:putative flippase GtrA
MQLERSKRTMGMDGEAMGQGLDRAQDRAAAEPGVASEARRALRYLLFGAMAAGVNWGSRFGWSLILPFQFAVVAAYATGMVFAFVTFRCFVFGGSGSAMGRQVRNFVIVNLLGITQTWILSMVMVHYVLPGIGWSFQPEACGHAVGIAAPTVTSWFGHRYFTFRAAKAAA